MSYIVEHEISNGQVVKQMMYDLGEARTELAAIVRNFRRWGFHVMHLGQHRFLISSHTALWSKIVSIETT